MDRIVTSLAIALTLACTPAPSEPPTPTGAVEVAPVSHEELVIPTLGLELGLPEPPAFLTSDAPAIDDDGIWSIHGLRSVLDELLPEAEEGKVVLVAAYVQEVYEQPECPKGELCPPGKQPHAWLVDDPRAKGKRDALMLIGYSFPIPEWDEQSLRFWESSPAVELVVGQRYVFMGWFRRFSESGFAHDKGLLELLAITEYPARPNSIWVVPPNGMHHPRARALDGREPLVPILATVPASVRAQTNLPDLGPLVEPRDRAHAIELAGEASDAGEPRRADYYLRWAIVEDPDSVTGWIELGRLYVDHGIGDLGLAVIDTAIARLPDDPHLHNGRGLLLLNLGRPTEAIVSYRRAVELRPNGADALFGLGMAYAEAAERELAVEILERFLAVSTDSPPHIERAARDTIMRMKGPL